MQQKYVSKKSRPAAIFPEAIQLRGRTSCPRLGNSPIHGFHDADAVPISADYSADLQRHHIAGWRQH